MKKVTLLIVLVFTLSFTVTSCKKDKTEVKTELKKDANASDQKDIAMHVYQCPMDCEKGKSYTKPGNCPVCKMELKAKKAGEEKKVEDHSGHNH